MHHFAVWRESQDAGKTSYVALQSANRL